MYHLTRTKSICSVAPSNLGYRLPEIEMESIANSLQIIDGQCNFVREKLVLSLIGTWAFGHFALK